MVSQNWSLLILLPKVGTGTARSKVGPGSARPKNGRFTSPGQVVIRSEKIVAVVLQESVGMMSLVTSRQVW